MQKIGSQIENYIRQWDLSMREKRQRERPSQSLLFGKKVYSGHKLLERSSLKKNLQIVFSEQNTFKRSSFNRKPSNLRPSKPQIENIQGNFTKIF